MRVFYLVPHVPNPTKIVSYVQLRGLIAAGHQVMVATVERTASDRRSIATLQQQRIRVISTSLSRFQILSNLLKVLPSKHPLQSHFMWSNELFRKIKTAVADFCPDVIHVEHLRMTPYALHFVDRYPSLWNAVDNIGVLYRQAISLGGNLPLRWIARLEAPRLEHYERWLISQFPVTTVITERDQQLFQQDNTYADRVQVVELGFPIPDLSTVQRDLQTLVITGTLNYHPNIASVHHFMAKIYPLIVQQFPAVHLQLVGANPDPTIQAYRSKNVEITGFVDSVTSYLEKSTIAMAPVLYGSGMQIKVIEAFLTATPLVATQIALRGLDVRDGEHVLIADTPEEFTRAILRLLGDSALRHRLGMAGREYVEKHHDLRITTQKLVEAYRIAIAQYQGI